MEYILVASLILIVFIPATFIFMNNIRKSTDELAESKLTRIGNDLVNTAYEVYYQGSPAKISLKINMPDKVLDMYVLKNWSIPANQLVIVLSKGDSNNTLVFDSEVNINGSFSTESFSKGAKDAVITANRSAGGILYSNIKII